MEKIIRWLYPQKSKGMYFDVEVRKNCMKVRSLKWNGQPIKYYEDSAMVAIDVTSHSNTRAKWTWDMILGRVAMYRVASTNETITPAYRMDTWRIHTKFLRLGYFSNSTLIIWKTYFPSTNKDWERDLVSILDSYLSW